MDPNLDKALDFARHEQDRFLTELKELLRIPSISSDPAQRAETERAAEWLAQRLRAMNVDQVQVQPTDGYPVVFGQLAAAQPGAPTILVYGHYDVQSAAPLADWRSDPFEPAVRDENLYARGATDMKGQVLACLAAVESVQQAGPLPVNLKFMFEGEEEIGSASLPAYLAAHREQLASDVSLNTDAGMIARDLPAIAYALRGSMVFKLIVRGPAKDLHSGIFGDTVHNPIVALAELIAGLHEADGRVAVPGFYDRVRPLEAAERAELARSPMDDAFYLRETGVPALWGEPGYTAVERVGARPAITVNHIAGGEPKSAIPAEAQARIGVRLVADQDPAEISALLQQYVADHTPPTVTAELVELAGGLPAVQADRNLPAVQAMRQALEEVWGVRPLFHRVGGSIPAVTLLQDILGIDSVLSGFSVFADDNLHGPNEKLHLPTWRRGIEALIRFFYLFGAS